VFTPNAADCAEVPLTVTGVCSTTREDHFGMVRTSCVGQSANSVMYAVAIFDPQKRKAGPKPRQVVDGY
jgi:hypothetical protein